MREAQVQLGMPKPGRALIGVLVALTCIWVLVASAVNWGGVSPAFLSYLIGDTGAVLSGQVWRLFTAPLLHVPTGGIGHLLFNLFGLYIFGTTLEDRWGSARFLRFLALSAVFAFAIQVVASAIAPSLGTRWLGSLGAVEATVVAWALMNRHATVRLFFVLPITGTGLIVFTFVLSVLAVVGLGGTPEGLATPFGGMLAGYLFGEGSPVRRAWLKLRLKKIQAETAAMQASRQRAARRAGSGLRVVPGGKDEPPKDKRFLN